MAVEYDFTIIFCIYAVFLKIEFSFFGSKFNQLKNCFFFFILQRNNGDTRLRTTIKSHSQYRLILLLAVHNNDMIYLKNFDKIHVIRKVCGSERLMRF
jgi:hypothetical protein